MAQNYGKQFEQKFKEDFLRIPESTCDRLVDVMTGCELPITKVTGFC